MSLSGLHAGRIAHCEGPRPSFACPYIRVSFASATDADLVEGIKRLATVIRKFQQEDADTDAPDSNGHTHVPAGPDNGNTGNGNHKQHDGTDRSVQETVRDNEQMSLVTAVHTAADSQPEAC